MLVAVVAAQMLSAMVARLVLGVAVLAVAATIVGWLVLELLTQAAVRVETEITERLALVALVLSSCLSQLLNTQAQPQAHQLSRQAVQTQF
jgi:uncharacterized membrane protein